jgi:uncharacterized protein YacL
MNKLNIKKTGYVVGVISLVFYVVCTVWGALIGSQELKELHVKLLEIAYPGFGFNFLGYIVGLIESFIYGWLLGAFFAWLCRKICVGGHNEA